MQSHFANLHNERIDPKILQVFVHGATLGHHKERKVGVDPISQLAAHTVSEAI